MIYIKQEENKNTSLVTGLKKSKFNLKGAYVQFSQEITLEDATERS